MRMKMYCIYDHIGMVAAKPFLLQNNEVAIRAVKDAMSQNDADFAKHPEDYSLYCIGEFNDSTMEIEIGQDNVRYPIKLVQLIQLKLGHDES